MRILVARTFKVRALVGAVFFATCAIFFLLAPFLGRLGDPAWIEYVGTLNATIFIIMAFLSCWSLVECFSFRLCVEDYRLAVRRFLRQRSVNLPDIRRLIWITRAPRAGTVLIYSATGRVRVSLNWLHPDDRL